MSSKPMKKIYKFFLVILGIFFIVPIIYWAGDKKNSTENTSSEQVATVENASPKPQESLQATDEPQIEEETETKPAKGMTRYSGDYGCHSYDTQVSRLAAMKFAYQSSMIRAQGLETEETKQIGEIAVKRMVELSKADCQELHGDYKIINRRKIAGGEAIQIQFDKNTHLWVLGE